VITPASLKEQWKREIERFSDEKAEIVEGGPIQRRAIYGGNGSLFKITNYEPCCVTSCSWAGSSRTW